MRVLYSEATKEDIEKVVHGFSAKKEDAIEVHSEITWSFKKGEKTINIFHFNCSDKIKTALEKMLKSKGLYFEWPKPPKT